MSLEKAAEQDGRTVWLATLTRPGEAAAWRETVGPRAGILACLDGWSASEIAEFCAAAAALAPCEVAFFGPVAEAARRAMSAAAPKTPVSAREDEPLDESVWYMFFSSDEPDPVTRRPPPLIVALRQGDARVAEFRALAARFSAAMNEVLERE